MKVSKKAQRIWFENNIIELNVYYHLGSIPKNYLIYDYNMVQGVTTNNKHTFFDLFLSEQKSLWDKLRKMQPWEIFFKYRHKFNRFDFGHPKGDGYYLSYERKVDIWK